MKMNRIEARISRMTEIISKVDYAGMSIDISDLTDEEKSRIGCGSFENRLYLVEKYDDVDCMCDEPLSGKELLDRMTTILLDRVHDIAEDYDEPDTFAILDDCLVWLETKHRDGEEGPVICDQFVVAPFSAYLEKIWSHGASERGAFFDMADGWA